MVGSLDLDRLIRGMDPDLRPGRFVFTTVDVVPDDVRPVATVREDEGTTLVVEQGEADRQGLTYDFVATMITLRVHSALDAVGLTAAVSGRLADAGIACNVVAGHFHDHLFVPADESERAVGLLRALARDGITATRDPAGRRSEGRAGR